MVYLKVVPVLVRPVRVCTFPSLNSCASTASKVRSDSTTDGLNSTVHVTVTSDPMVTGLAKLLAIVTEAGRGTETELIFNYHVH